MHKRVAACNTPPLATATPHKSSLRDKLHEQLHPCNRAFNEHRILYKRTWEFIWNFILISNWMRKRKQPITDRFWSCSKHSQHVQNTRSTFLNLIKHCCSCFKHYLKQSINFEILWIPQLHGLWFMSSRLLSWRIGKIILKKLRFK